MQKKGKMFLSAVCAALIGLSCAACAPKEQAVSEQYDRETDMNLGIAAQEAVSPFLYGQFIEHIETCVYNGIWAEMVLDRKFYYEIGERGLSPWTSEGDVTSDASDTYSNGYAARIGAGGSISQEDISLEAKEYTGYFYARADEASGVRVALSADGQTAEASVDIEAGGWKKYEWSIAWAQESADATFTLRVQSGSARFDSLSMMPEDNYLGMRQDTLDLLKELDSPIYRWPGGNFLSGYDWKDGIGDRDARPSRRNLYYMQPESSFASETEQIVSDIANLSYLGFYGGIEPNDFGVDEFLAMCDYLGAQPLMMVNDGLGSVQDAADLVEYCNGSASSEWGAKRAANGHAEPYAIRYWGVGNEMFGDWQLGHVPVQEYTARHNEFSRAMKAADDTIELIAVGNNASDWNDFMFSSCAEYIDYSAEHFYGVRDEADVVSHISNMKKGIEERIANHRALLAKYPACADVAVAFTEYAYDEAVTASRLKDGMGIAAALNSFIENADVVKMAFYSSTVNATQGCITTTDTEAQMQGAGYVLMQYRKYMQAYSLTCATRVNAELNLDAAATVSEDGKTVAVAVVNPSEYAVRLNCARFVGAKQIERHTLTAEFYDSDGTEMRLEDAVLAYAVAPAMSVSIFVVTL